MPLRRIKLSLAVGTVLVIGLAFWAHAYVDRTAGAMASAADRFVKALDDGQRQQAHLRLRRLRAAQLALHPPRAQGAADQGR